jgi:hypothetical protein
MSQTPVTIIKLEDWPQNIPINWRQFVGCELFHRTKGWFTLDAVGKEFLWVSNQQGVEDGISFNLINKDLLKVRVPTDSEIVKTYEDVNHLGSLSLLSLTCRTMALLKLMQTTAKGWAAFLEN